MRKTTIRQILLHQSELIKQESGKSPDKHLKGLRSELCFSKNQRIYRIVEINKLLCVKILAMAMHTTIKTKDKGNASGIKVEKNFSIFLATLFIG